MHVCMCPLVSSIFKELAVEVGLVRVDIRGLLRC